jgi:hypothetical protein
MKRPNLGLKIGKKVKVRRLLEEYCGLDTMGMVDIVEKLNSFK